MFLTVFDYLLPKCSVILVDQLLQFLLYTCIQKRKKCFCYWLASWFVEGIDSFFYRAVWEFHNAGYKLNRRKREKNISVGCHIKRNTAYYTLLLYLPRILSRLTLWRDPLSKSSPSFLGTSLDKGGVHTAEMLKKVQHDTRHTRRCHPELQRSKSPWETFQGLFHISGHIPIKDFSTTLSLRSKWQTMWSLRSKWQTRDAELSPKGPSRGFPSVICFVAVQHDTRYTRRTRRRHPEFFISGSIDLLRCHLEEYARYTFSLPLYWFTL